MSSAAWVEAQPRPFWLDSPLAPAPADPFAGEDSCSLAVVGGGFTGLWAALQAKQDDPARDVEADELFVVVSGRATIEIEDGPTLEVGPGDVCVLEEGARTVWTIHETLRKAYQILLPAS